MNINKKNSLKTFINYTANYDLKNIGIALKIAHTYRVAELSERIASVVANPQQIMNIEAADFAWLLGIFHDIGRFEQITRYGTFKDAISIDHAELGADILFCDGLFYDFISDIEPSLTADELNILKNIAEKAIRLHNKLKIPENIDNDTKMYTKILRDADKIDIFRVLNEAPYTGRNLKGLAVNEKIMQFVREHRCVPRTSINVHYNELEALISQCCMAFELEFDVSRQIAAKQGYLNKLLNYDNQQLSILKSEVFNTWKILL